MVSSLVTERAARNLAITEKEADVKLEKRPERILVPLSNPENMQRLMDFSLLIKNPKSVEPIYPLSIVEDDHDADEKLRSIKKVIESIIEQIASVDKKVEILKKVDLNIVDGIVRTAKAYSITDIILSWKAQQNTSNFIFGSVSDNLLDKTDQMVMVTRIIQPMNSFSNVIVVLTPNAELEPTFKRTCIKINRILKQVGKEAFVYGEEKTLFVFKNHILDKNGSMYKYKAIDTFEESDFINKSHSTDDLYVILNSRKQTVSYDYHVDNLPRVLSKSYEYSSFVVIYPETVDHATASQFNEMTTVTVQENLEKIIQVKDKIKGIFNRS